MESSSVLLVMVVLGFMSGALCAVVASEKNRGPAIWGIVGFFLPLLALIAIAGIPVKTDRIRRCPFCTESIGLQATICPFCNRQLKPAVLCAYNFCDIIYVEQAQAIYTQCNEEGCEEQHAFCSTNHAEFPMQHVD